MVPSICNIQVIALKAAELAESEGQPFCFTLHFGVIIEMGDSARWDLPNWQQITKLQTYHHKHSELNLCSRSAERLSVCVNCICVLWFFFWIYHQ